MDRIAQTLYEMCFKKWQDARRRRDQRAADFWYQQLLKLRDQLA